MPTSLEEFASVAIALCDRVELGPAQFFRLVGVGLSNFQVEAELNSPLFQQTSATEDGLLSASN